MILPIAAPRAYYRRRTVVLMNPINRVTAYWNRPERAAYLFLAPSLIILVCFSLIPVLASFAISFMKMNLFLSDVGFAGLKNYQKLWADARMWNSLKNTMIFVLGEVPLQVCLGLVVAAMVTRNTRFNKMMRAAYFVPVICSLTSIGIILSMMLDTTIGIIPYFCKLLGLGSPTFLKSVSTAMPTVIAVTAWKNFGHTAVILLAGMQSIAPAYYEAADVEGAGKGNQFLRITIPLLLPNIAFCVVTNLIGSMQVFDQVYVMTRGGPLYSTESAVMYIYTRGFNSPFQLGYASAIAVALCLIIMALSLTLNRWFIAREEGIYR